MFENDVDVRLARGNGNAIRYCEKDEFENDGGSKRITFTRLVYEKPAIDVAIHLNFGSDFDLYSADGVAILLSWDSTSVKGYREKQLFWIDKADVTTEFVVKSTKGFSPITGAVSSWQLNMPAQSEGASDGIAITSWASESKTPSGCIAVSIRRGSISNRTGFMSRRDLYEPSWTQYQTMKAPKVIREDWFTPLAGESGDAMAFHFVNTKDAAEPQAPENDDHIAAPDELLRAQPPPYPKRKRQLEIEQTAASCRSKRERWPTVWESHYDAGMVRTISSTASTNRKKSGKLKAKPKAKKIFKAKTARWTSDDDQDDEELLRQPITDHKHQAEIKREEYAETTAGPRAAILERPGPIQDQGRGVQQKYRHVNQNGATPIDSSTYTPSTSPQAPAHVNTDDDEELLRLQLEENRLMQRMRKKQLQRTAKG